MKTLTSTKRTTRRIAASIAIVLALATTGAWAANIYWTGKTDNYAGTASNWSANRFPTDDGMYFDSSKYHERFTDNEVVFDGAYANAYHSYINVGTAENPLVFRATDAAYGLAFGGLQVGNTSAAYLKLGAGAWSTGSGKALAIKDGQLILTDGATFSVGSTLTLAKGVLVLTDGASLSVGSDIYMDKASSKLTVTGGATLTGGYYFCFRNGEVILENGTIEVPNQAFQLGDYGAVTLNLNEGGVLGVKQIAKKTNGGTVVFNGGTLKELSGTTLIADDGVIVVKVGALGGTIDANNRAVTFSRPIAPDGENDGGMTFKGGGSVSLKYANTYTGATKIELGTKIIATTADAKASVLGNLAVTGVAADGDYYVFEYSGLTDEDVAGATISHGGAAGTTITREGDQIKVHYVAPAVDLGWNGGNAAWATASAWTNATGTAKTWSDGNHAVFATGDTVTLGADVAALSATFNAGATIAAGGGTLTVPVVDVGLGVFATIAAPTAGALEKTGAGTLMLGSSRAETATTLTEGTLVANAPVGTLTLGTDAAKPVTFDYDGQTYSTSFNLNNGCEVTLTNCTFSSFARVANGTVHVAKGAIGYINGWLCTGPESDRADTAVVLDICGGVVSNASRNVSLGDRGEPGATSEVRVRNGGLFTTGDNIVVGARAAVTLNIDDGSVIVPYEVQFCQTADCKVNEDCFLNLNAGGLLWVRSITYGSGAANATFTFNGGTLKANQDYTLIHDKANLSVVTATSGTIDADGHAVTIAKAISGAGGMVYQGGGRVTFTVTPVYTGDTTVEVGTMLVVPAAIAGDKLAFSVPDDLADGVYTVVSISGDSQFADDVLSGKAEGFVLSGDKKKICYMKGMDTTKPIYIGTDGNLSAAGNWFDNTVPTGGTGDAQIFCTAASTLTVGDTFAPAKLVILGGSALVTIGSGTLYVSEVVNRQLLAVGTGATVVIGDQLILAKGESLCDQNNGTLVVSNLLLKAESGDRFVTANQTTSASGVFKFNAVTNSMTDNWFYFANKNNLASAGVFYIGEGGLSFLNASKTAGYCLGRGRSGNSTTIRPWYSDFKIADSGTGNDSLILMRNVTFCTDDENGKGRTITIEARTNPQSSPVITVSGSGTLQMNGTKTGSAQPPITVTDTATLAFGANGSLGTGDITLGAGTKLVLTANSKDFTALANTLNLPTEGSATIRIDGERLKSGDNIIIATVGNDATTANVAFDGNSTALAGRKYTLRVEDGKLILKIVSDGTVIIVR